MKRRLTKFIMGTLLGAFVLGTTAFAAEEYVGFNVTPTSAVGYTNVQTVVVADATGAGTVVLNAEQCPDAIGIIITGITDTGFWQVDLGQPQKFYIAGPFLENITLTDGANVGNTGTTANNGNAGAVTNNGATVNNGTGNTGTVIDSSSATTNAQSGVVTSGEEACIQYLLANRSSVVKTANDVEMCRYFYREYMKLYEQAKAIPTAYTKCYSEYYDDAIDNYAGCVGGYLSKNYDNYAFGQSYKHPYLDRLCVYRTENMSDKGVYFE